MRSGGVQNAPETGRKKEKNWEGIEGRLEALYPFEIPQNRQRFVWKSLEQNTRLLEKLGKRLGGGLYFATVGSLPPAASDRAGSSLRGAKRRSNRGVSVTRPLGCLAALVVRPRKAA